MRNESDYIHRIKMDCEHLDTKKMSCRKAESGEAISNHKNCSCMDCLIGIYYLSLDKDEKFPFSYTLDKSKFSLQGSSKV